MTTQRRPPVAVRVFAGLLGLLALGFNAALMLSDRAPGALQRAFGDLPRRLSERLDASERLRQSTDAQLPESDAIVHIGVWAVAMLFVALTVWSWRWLLVAAIAVFAASVLVELGQGRWSDTRAVEASDVAANALGVAIGTASAVVLYAIYSALAAAIAPRK